LKPNVDVAVANFKGTRLGPPWTIHYNPVDDKPVADPRGRAGAGAPALGNRAAQRRPR
jgi:hypothetical protein